MDKALDKIEVEGFKSIRSMSLEFRGLNVLIGANGVGKSNFLGVFKLLNRMYLGALQVYIGTCGGADALLHFGRKSTSSIRIKAFLGNYSHGYECTLAPTADDRLIFEQESCWFQDASPEASPFTVSFGSGHSESGLKPTRFLPQRKSEVARERRRSAVEVATAAKERAVTGYVVRALFGEVYHFHDTSDSAAVKLTSSLDDNHRLNADAGNLAAFLYRLKTKNPGDYSNIVSAVRLVFPFFDDFTLEPSRLNPDKIRLEWRERGSDTYFNASALSDGTLRFICLATLLLQPDLPSTILLDEPELGLHPYAINVLAELLRGAATKTQVIASTQSVGLVNQFEPEDVIVVEREDQQSVFRHLDRADMQSWLDDYGLGDLWEKNIIGGRP
jgi:predicted ATPase